MRQLIRPWLLLVLIFAVPIVPFLLFGSQLHAVLQDWSERGPSSLTTAFVVMLLLASDILLPIPSSLICTLAGWKLGFLLGTLVTWTGLNVGAIVGYYLARQWGGVFARWFSSDADLQRAAMIADRYGPMFLALARGVPVLAEASVLWVGMHKLSWPRFLPPVLLGNLVLAAAFSGLGQAAQESGWLPMALAASVALPIAVALIVKHWWTGKA